MIKTTIHAYLISDSSGETVVSVSRAAFAQFEELIVTEYIKPLIRSQEQVDQLLNEVMQHSQSASSLIIYTVLNAELREYLHKKCQYLGVRCISAIAKVVSDIGQFIGQDAITKGKPGKHRMLDKSYYDKINVINFTMQHDDGHCRTSYNEADIILLGVSRTSKSPTALYLAQRGYKVANLPLIPEILVDLSNLKHPLIIGLTIAPEILNQIRNNRILSLDPLSKSGQHSASSDHYTNIEKIYEELEYARKIFSQYKLPVVDVSRKAIEEIVAEIINIYSNKCGTRIIS
jgi:[pyruvate, water dikinase]-phosphate phosphotransferase / [pyruvate, water dikinase] kinase